MIDNHLMDDKEIILRCADLTKTFTSGLVRTKTILAVKDATFDIKRGEIVSIVGESGSGKTTIARMILRLIKPTSGSVFLNGEDIHSYKSREYYKQVQAVFQDPYAAFNPFYKVDHIIERAFALIKGNLDSDERQELVESTLMSIGLNPSEVLGRRPHELSGGQMQRLLIGRSLLIGSQLLIADEPTSMIDASTRAGVLNLLLRLKEERGLSVLFITHDIGQAQYASDRVLIMKEGEIVEQGPVNDVFMSPKHPYTQELLAAVPSLYEKWDDIA